MALLRFSQIIAVADFLSTILVLGFTTMTWSIFWHQLQQRDLQGISSNIPKMQATNIVEHLDLSLLNLAPGELPGYTGWARPSASSASLFHTINSPSNRIAVGEEWRIIISCCVDGDNSKGEGTSQPSRHCGGNQYASHFFVRAYGPAVITGKVKKLSSDSGINAMPGSSLYEISFVPRDAGWYTVEVILTFSSTPPWDEFPLSNDQKEPSYEGYLLPDFPLFLQVLPRRHLATVEEPKKAIACPIKELTVTNTESGIDQARWRVVSKANTIMPSTSNEDHRAAAILQGYQQLDNSLGIHMQYEFINCSLISVDNLKKRLLKQASKPKDEMLHFIFIGDSVMRMQMMAFESMTKEVDGIQTTLISTSGGIAQTMKNVTSGLRDFLGTKERRFILFNTGLHDINQLCFQNTAPQRRQYISKPDNNFSCIQEYHHRMERLVSFIRSFPADLRVFQTTTAGWPRYGNFGFGWPLTVFQPFTLSSNFVARMNDVAVDVLREQDQGVLIMDGYWITLARPDNREIGMNNPTGKRMVHPGKEVLNAMVQVWGNIVVNSLSKPRWEDHEQ